MSADLLREASAKMRERAERAESLRFWPSDDHDGMDETYTWAELVADLPGDDGLSAHVESWHPAVALAVATLLASTAGHIESYDCEAHCEPDGCDAVNDALAVARAYLGSDA